ncbi:MAG: hypothetical protein V4608_02540 [Bacteroidota bacterium]
MKNYLLLLLGSFILFFSGCAAIGEIFKTGVWFGVVIVLGVIALILYVINRNKN